MFTVTNYAVGSGNSFMQLDSSFIIIIQLCVNKSFLIHQKKKRVYSVYCLIFPEIKCEFAILVAFHTKHIVIMWSLESILFLQHPFYLILLGNIQVKVIILLLRK